jgi:hypothetical protein
VGTLHILRSPVAADVAELVVQARHGDTTIRLTESEPDYDELLHQVFEADRVICWW